ncbi:MAG: hypothetical protein D6748_02705 [Calditrichaeota bacterium]|nr:MAG: hypothetical protein D6748_02705 [Calditrichota bacterium]
MKNCIGIRRETKDTTERRAPLTPAQVEKLVKKHGIRVIVEPSPQRVFTEEEYQKRGAEISEDLRECNIIFGVKEIPIPDLEPEQTYCFFSHTIKAQPYNMPMLKKILELKDTLLDYELVKDHNHRRTIFFGNFAGYAGMIDSLWALGRRLQWEGYHTPFAEIQPAHQYESLEAAKAAIREVGNQIREHGLPPALTPFVCGFTGYGQVSKGAQEIYDLLPSIQISAGELTEFFRKKEFDSTHVYKVEFHKYDMFEPIPGQAHIDEFTWFEFNEHPEFFQGKFEQYVPYLTMLINGIYWEPRYPRLLSKKYLKELFQKETTPRLRIIGDITCDIEGSIEATVKATNSRNPVYVYHPETGEALDGWEGRGVVILAVDKLPTELPRESSEFFGNSLLPYVPGLAAADFNVPFEALELPEGFKEAVIVHQGKLTPSFQYLKPAVQRVEDD